MKESNPNDRIEFFKPPVPRARPPIRKMNVTEETDCYNFKRNMYKAKQQNQEYLSMSNNDVQYTDDEAYDDDDENDDYDEEDSFTNNLSNLSPDNSLLLKSFSTAHNSPVETQAHKRSFHSPNTSRTTNNSYSSSISHRVQSKPVQGSSTRNHSICLCIVVCIAFFVVANYLINTQAVPYKDEVVQRTATIDLSKVNNVLDKSMKIIQARFKNQKINIWNDISAGIYDIVLFPKRPSIITLFGNETNTLNCLAQLLGQLSGYILGSNDYLTLTPKDFPNDVGRVIYTLKAQIVQKKAVIVQDLLSINVEAIRAFHNFCDRENPLIGHAIYVITVIVDGYKSSQRELEFIERQMYKKLSKHIDKDILAPLVTRLTDGVIVPIFPESSTNFDHVDCSFSINNKL